MLSKAAGEKSPETLDLITTEACVFSFSLSHADGISAVVVGGGQQEVIMFKIIMR